MGQFCIIVIVLWISAMPALADNGKSDPCSLTLGWEHFGPYQFTNERNKLTGFDFELVQAIVDDMGCNLEIKQINWARGLFEIQAGEIDILPHADFVAERTHYAWFSTAYRSETSVIYVKEGGSAKYPLNSLSDIIDSNFRLGVGRGVFIGEEFARLIKSPSFRDRVYYIPTDEVQQYKMLQAGRIDGFVRSINALENLRKKLNGKLDLEIHPLPINTSEQHFLFSRKTVDKALVARFNASLLKLRKNGVYQQLEARFLSQNKVTD